MVAAAAIAAAAPACTQGWLPWALGPQGWPQASPGLPWALQGWPKASPGLPWALEGWPKASPGLPWALEGWPQASPGLPWALQGWPKASPGLPWPVTRAGRRPAAAEGRVHGIVGIAHGTAKMELLSVY